MQTQLIQKLLNKNEMREADHILRKCVHCGFCNTVCPTYQISGNELDGPRGRIYQIKRVLEGETADTSHLFHLDRCLECQACETTCPSGVRYTRLLRIGRNHITRKIKRSWLERGKRFFALRILPDATRTRHVLNCARLIKPLLPQSIGSKIPPAVKTQPYKMNGTHKRRVLLLGGCVQTAVTPEVNAHCRYLLHQLGIETIELNAMCCAALPYHMGDHRRAHAMIEDNITKIRHWMDKGVEAIISTASGCGNMLKCYGKVLEGKSTYQAEAERIALLHKDISEIIAAEMRNNPNAEKLSADYSRAVFQCPCSLQHGQKLNGMVETILSFYGVELLPTKQTNMCCGSAGYYSLSQPQIATQLRDNKLQNLLTDNPSVILTANIGCQLHLQAASPVPVKHWIQLLH